MDNSSVLLGVWTNWSNGRVMGATLTTTRQHGDLLIAFTAFLIPYVASRLWRIFCIILHRYYSTAEGRDAIHHQRQVILRNSSSPDSGLASLMFMLWAWGTSKHAPSQKKTQLFRLFPTTVIAICCVAAFVVAGGFSSRISSAPGDIVLLSGDHCGILTVPNTTTTPITNYYQAEAQILNEAANYAQQCYSSTGSGILDCDRFVVKNLNTAIIQTNLSCPFQDGLCRSNNSNLLLDSGYIDSNNDFGLNTPADQRFKWRYVLQCAPLVTEGYASQIVIQNRTWVQYNYGSFVEGNADTNSSFTYAIEDLDSQYYLTNAGAGYDNPGGVNYRLVHYPSYTYQGEIYMYESDFEPIPQLFRVDGDVSITFLSGNGIMFDGPLDDEWYRATVFGANLSRASGDQTVLKGYESSEAASPLGCVQQWQWCSTANTTNGGCGPLGSKYDSLEGAIPYFNLPSDAEEVDRPNSTTLIGTLLTWPSLMQIEGAADVGQIVEYLGPTSLTSKTLLENGLQLPLPSNQWQHDVTNWWNIALAARQAQFVNTAVGTTDPILEQGLWTPINDQETRLCNNQKIRSTAYASFSLFGLLFTYISSILIIITSFILAPIFGLLQRRRKYKEYAHLEWTTNGTLQLHRLAQEELGCGEWEAGTDTVPTERTGAMMAGLDLKDLVHPSLVKPAVEEEKKEIKSGSENGGSEMVQSPVSTPKIATHVHVENIDDEHSASGGSPTIEVMRDLPAESQTRTGHERDTLPATSLNDTFQNPDWDFEFERQQQ